MAIGRVTSLGVGAATLALVATTGFGFAPPPTQLPTVTVHHNPT
jgi:hypothetical protein